MSLLHQKGQRIKAATYLSGGINIVLSVGQVIIGAWAGSQALIADGIHTLSDLIADLVVLLSVRWGHAKADDDHHYGHLRYENIASLVLGILLLMVGVGVLWAAGHKLWEHSALVAPNPIALWVALFALLLKEGLFQYLKRLAKTLNSSLLMANAWHARTDAASSLIVLVGIGGSVMGLPWLDPVSAIVVACLLLLFGQKIVMNALQDLSDRAIGGQVETDIKEAILRHPEVHSVNALRTRKSGDLILLDVSIDIDGALTVHAGHEIAHQVMADLREHFPILDVVVHTEPYQHEAHDDHGGHEGAGAR